MTNNDALINIAVAQQILTTLLTELVGADAAAELMGGVVTTAAAAGLAGDFKAVKDTYDGDPDAFVDTQANIDDLDDVVDAIVDMSIPDFASSSGNAYDALQTASPEV